MRKRIQIQSHLNQQATLKGGLPWEREQVKKTKGKIVSGCNFKQNKYSRKDFSSYNPDMTQAQSTCSFEFKCVFSH